MTAFNNLLARKLADPQWAQAFAAETARIAAIDTARNMALATGHPVMSRPMASDPKADAEWAKRLGQAGQQLAAARAKEKSAREKARKLAIDAAAAGQSEAGIARMLGVDRMAVREWLGKREPPKPKPDDHPSTGTPARPKTDTA